MEYECFDKDFNQLRKRYLNAEEKRSKAQSVFNEARISADCSLCPLFKVNEGKQYKEWMTGCNSKRVCMKVTKSYQNFEKAALEYAVIQEAYAKSVLQNLSVYKPNLLRRTDKAILNWDSVFNNDMNEFSEEIQKSLVALIEEDGGKYRLVRN